MIIELSEDEIRYLVRMKQIYYAGMYHDLYEKNNEKICDKYCEELMKSSIEDIVSKINAGIQK